MTEEEKQQKWKEFQERQAFERTFLEECFTKEQAREIQLYCESYFYKKPNP